MCNLFAQKSELRSSTFSKKILSMRGKLKSVPRNILSYKILDEIVF